jgi:hypothetical protein
MADRWQQRLRLIRRCLGALALFELDCDFNNIRVRSFILTGAPFHYLDSIPERLVSVLVPKACP